MTRLTFRFAVLGLAAALAVTAGSVAARTFVPASAKTRLAPATVERAVGQAPVAVELRFTDGGTAAFGTLRADRPVLLGPLPAGGAVVPAGRHEIEIAPWGPAGGLRLVLRTSDGFQLAVPLAAAARAPGSVGSLEDLGAPGTERWPLAVHLLGASGLIVLEPPAVAGAERAAPAGADPAGADPRARRDATRSERLERRRERRGLPSERRGRPEGTEGAGRPDRAERPERR